MTPDQNEGGALKPCPFCGSGPATVNPVTSTGFSGVELLRNDHDEPIWHVWCGNCGATSQESYTPSIVIAAWNKRAADAALLESLEACANSLEAELRARYPIEAEGHSPYPTMKRRYDRDMAEVLQARAAITKARGK